MNTLQIIDRIQSLYSKGVPSDDSRLTDREVYSKLVTVRQKLLTQQIKKRQRVSDWSYTVLPCVELIKVPRVECECLADLKCEVYRTKFPMPKILTDYDKHIIQYVLSVDNGDKFNEVTRQEILVIKGNKYTGKNPKFIIENGYLYFPMNGSPGVIKMKVLAEDPLEAARYPSFCGDETECRHYADIEFPIDGDMIDVLIETSLGELLEVFGRGNNDGNNDSRDEAGVSPRPAQTQSKG